jgi:HD-GYP domain-containing protein (c-di-GMP phosphodiesterase class II)/DNA-binding NarL/FixJ family response regulator
MDVALISDHIDEFIGFQEYCKENKIPINIKYFATDEEFISKVSKLNPEITIFDIERRENFDLDIVRILVEAQKKSRIAVLTNYEEEIDPVVKINFGIEKVFNKNSTYEQIVSYIKDSGKKPAVVFPEETHVYLEDLKEMETVPVDLHTKIRDDNVHLFKANTPVDRNRVAQYIEKGLKHVFIDHKGSIFNQCKLNKPFSIKIMVNSKKVALFDLFVRVKSEYKLFLKKGQVLSSQHIDILKKLKVNRVHVRNSEIKAIENYFAENFNTFVTDERVPTKEKTHLLTRIIGKQLNQTLNKPTENNILKLFKLNGHLEILLEKNDDAIKEIIQQSSFLGFKQHSINVATLAFGLILECCKMKYLAEFKLKTDFYDNVIFSNDISKEIIFLSGLIHEIGRVLRKLYSASAQYKNLIHLEENEDINQLAHPAIAAKLLTKYKELNPKIIEIVGQHLEYNDGSGIPRNLRSNRLSLYSQVMILANYYEELRSVHKLDSEQAIENIKKNMLKFNKYLVDAIIRIV